MRFLVFLRSRLPFLLISYPLPALVSSIIIIMHACLACLACNYPEALSHCGHGHNLTSVAQFSIINIADIIEVLSLKTSEHFRRNAVNSAL